MSEKQLAVVPELDADGVPHLYTIVRDGVQRDVSRAEFEAALAAAARRQNERSRS